MGKLSNAKKLTKTEEYAIEGMYNNGMSVKEISKALARDTKLIEELVSSFEEEAPSKEEKTPHESKGFAVMTEATSQRVDHVRQTMPKPARNSAIHTIN
tara:strand:+ start:490 stop:786 length:297 start_codon:yes stop_codon:yes gene_type:complete